MSPQLAAMERLAPAARQAGAAPGVPPGHGRAPGRGRACSPAACRAPSSPASTPPPRGCCRPRAATSSCRRRRAAAARCRCTTAASPRAQEFARALVDAFEDTGVEYVVVNSAGCGSTMKEYAELLADDPAYADRARAFAERVRDVSEILDELGPVAPRHPLEVTVAYHDACHLGARPGRPRAAPPAARGDPRARAARDRRGRAVLRLRRASTTSSTPSRRASSATARRRTSSPPAPSCSSPPTRAA